MDQIVKRLRASSTTSLKVYSCAFCKDTGWIESYSGKYKMAKQCRCIKESLIDKQWRDFGLDPTQVKGFNDYNPYDQTTTRAKTIAHNYAFSFEKIKDTPANNWIALMGQPGAGKSHLVTAIGEKLIKKNIKVVYMPYALAIMELKGTAKDFSNYEKLYKRYAEAPVLIIDDLFKDKVGNGTLTATLNEVDRKHIYPLLNERYTRNLPTVISTELTPDMLQELDQALCGRILEKCKFNCVVFNNENYNYRLKIAREN